MFELEMSRELLVEHLILLPEPLLDLRLLLNVPTALFTNRHSFQLRRQALQIERFVVELFLQVFCYIVIQKPFRLSRA
jgi:hypothetical protein